MTACGVRFLRECDPYDVPAFSSLLEEADRYSRSEEGGVAVIISKHSCPVDKRAAKPEAFYVMEVSDACDGCKLCLKQFECPALTWTEAGSGTEKLKTPGRVSIDHTICTDCGVCRHVCPKGAFMVVKEVVA